SLALRKRLKAETPNIRKELTILRPAEKLSGVNTLNNVLQQMGRVVDPLQRDLNMAGMEITVATLLLSAAVLGLGTFLLVSYLTGNSMFGLPAGAIGAAIPFIVVRQKKASRMQRFEEQFPEAIDLIGRALRAGHAFTTGLAMVAEEIQKP